MGLSQGGFLTETVWTHIISALRCSEVTPVYFHFTVSDKAVVSLQPNWPLIFGGEMITVRCDIHQQTYSELEYFRMDYIDFIEYDNTEWEYEWSSPNSDTVPTSGEYRIRSATVSNSGNYRCMGKLTQDLYSSTEWSDVITLTVSCKLAFAYIVYHTCMSLSMDLRSCCGK